jgi:hypothetical protein
MGAHRDGGGEAMVRTNRFLRLTLVSIAMVAATAPWGLGPRPAQAAVTGSCVIEGTMSISPGLGATPTPNGYSLSGTASPCFGATAGPFSATISCANDTLATCVSTAGGFINVTSSPFGTCNAGFVQHAFAAYTFSCLGLGAQVGPSGSFLLLVSGASVPIRSAIFIGSLDGVGP